MIRSLSRPVRELLAVVAILLLPPHPSVSQQNPPSCLVQTLSGADGTGGESCGEWLTSATEPNQ